VLPCLEPAAIYSSRAGEEILAQMYAFEIRGRQLCLRPEATATCQLLAAGPLRNRGETRVWYEARCWRYETPQQGRYREFTQFGVEILNPRTQNLDRYRRELIELAERMITEFEPDYRLAPQVKRGLAYYTQDGFEITSSRLGAQQQLLGGGGYERGIGFAIGVDRLGLAAQMANTIS
jgi:histidyl-tRNA synthetase